jgi:uncharacterized membrane protein
MEETPNEPEYTTVPPANPQYPPPTTPPYPTPVASSGLSDNSAGAIAYLTIIPAIIFLVMEPYNKNAFIKFHSFQSIGLFVVAIIVFVVQMVLIFVPFIGWLISLCLTIGLLAAWVIAIIKASKGEWFKLPVIGDFAMKQAKS